MSVELLDSRGAFDPTKKDPRPGSASLRADGVGGHGLLLVHAYAKDLSYLYDGTYNHVAMNITCD